MRDPKSSFGQMEDKLLSCCRQTEPDIVKMQAYIADGADVNAVNGYQRTMLEEILHGYYCESGKNFPVLTSLFLKNGFDVKRYGMNCIEALVYSTYNQYAFRAAKILLQAGVVGPDEKWSGIISAIGTEESYQRCCQKNQKFENLYFAFYEIVEKAFKKQPFEDIDIWENFHGKRIDRVIVTGTNTPCIKEIKPGRFAIEDKLLLCSKDRCLILEDTPNIYSRNIINAIPENADIADVEYLKPIVGATITKITFSHRETVKNYRQPNIWITFDNGQVLRISTDFGEVPDEETSTYFEWKHQNTHKMEQGNGQ